MAVATASEHDHVLAALRRCDMEKYFDGILTCAEVGSGKDEPEIFRACLNALGTAKSETAVLRTRSTRRGRQSATDSLLSEYTIKAKNGPRSLKRSATVI